MNIALAITHKDQYIGVYWAKWVAALGGIEEAKVFVGQTLGGSKAFNEITLALSKVCDLKTFGIGGGSQGYPMGSNTAFREVMDRACEDGKPVAWLEVDCVPVKKNWYKQIKEEYYRHKKPFCGPFVGGPAHMNGTGIYPPNWRKLTTISSCPPKMPWDCHIGKDVIKQMHRSPLWQHGPRFIGFSDYTLGLIKPKTVMFHPCKNLSLIRTLNERFGKVIPETEFKMVHRYYLCTCLTTPPIMNSNIKFLDLGLHAGSKWGITSTNDIDEQCEISRLTYMGGVTEIGKEDYQKYLKQIAA